jgi:2-polyprenyl-6-hydroxyphenyl methylase / 3-demethylubiquinone-9 3-methyltransferase
MRAPSVDEAEVERFERLAATWWDHEGPMRALHAMNPARLGWIRREVARHFGLDPSEQRILAERRVLDIGCGGGLLCEPLARLGAQVTGIDPAGENIEVAKAHGDRSGLAIDYRKATVEDVADEGERFDVLLAMEVVEHVADVHAFLCACESVLEPGGILLMSTLNRTLRSFALAIVGAEYVLRWLPRGTHRWDKFVTPNELEAALERNGLRTIDERGVIYNILLDAWQLSGDMDVNYMVAAERPA